MSWNLIIRILDEIFYWNSRHLETRASPKVPPNFTVLPHLVWKIQFLKQNRNWSEIRILQNFRETFKIFIFSRARKFGNTDCFKSKDTFFQTRLNLMENSLRLMFRQLKKISKGSQMVFRSFSRFNQEPAQNKHFKVSGISVWKMWF